MPDSGGKFNPQGLATCEAVAQVITDLVSLYVK